MLETQQRCRETPPGSVGLSRRSNRVLGKIFQAARNLDGNGLPGPFSAVASIPLCPTREGARLLDLRQGSRESPRRRLRGLFFFFSPYDRLRALMSISPHLLVLR